MEFFNLMAKAAEDVGLQLSEQQYERFMKYMRLLQEWNEKINLTAITEDEEVVKKHFIDCIKAFKRDEFKKAETLIDVGTGAGFPGMVLAIFNENIRFTLMDSIGKKTKFLQMVKDELGLENVEIVTSRAEDFISDEKRESYDLGLCRGVSKLSTILELSLIHI